MIPTQIETVVAMDGSATRDTLAVNQTILLMAMAGYSLWTLQLISTPTQRKCTQLRMTFANLQNAETAALNTLSMMAAFVAASLIGSGGNTPAPIRTARTLTSLSRGLAKMMQRFFKSHY